MTKKLLLVATVLAAASLLVPLSAAPKRPAGPEFGDAEAGLRVAVEMMPTDWRPNARVDFICTVENTSKQPIVTSAWGLDLLSVLEIRDAAGNAIAPEAERKGTAHIPRGDIVTVAPGEKQRFVLHGRITREKALVVKELLGGQWIWPLADGGLSVRAVFQRDAGAVWARPFIGKGWWTGRAVSAPRRAVMSSTPIEAGEAVGGLRLKLNVENTDLRMEPDGRGGWKIEPAKVEIGFVNEIGETLKIDARDLFAGAIRFEVDGPDDDAVRVSKLDLPVPRPAGDLALLDPATGWSPQAPITFPGPLGNMNYELKKPGEYRVSAFYSSDAKGFWNGLVQSNVVLFTVVGGPTPGGAPVKGLKFDLAADPKEILIDGEPSKLTLTFTNTGAEPIKLDAYDVPFRNLTLTVIGPDRKPLDVRPAVVPAREVIAPTEGDYPVIAPGKSWSMKVRPRFPGEFGVSVVKGVEAGLYRVIVTYENKPVPEGGEYKPFVKGCWTGIIVSNEVTINVLPEIKRGR